MLHLYTNPWHKKTKKSSFEQKFHRGSFASFNKNSFLLLILKWLPLLCCCIWMSTFLLSFWIIQILLDRLFHFHQPVWPPLFRTAPRDSYSGRGDYFRNSVTRETNLNLEDTIFSREDWQGAIIQHVAYSTLSAQQGKWTELQSTYI